MSALDALTAALSDRYRVERELGRGGMATVYLAHDLKHDRKVALKVLRPELAAILGAERFLAEIRTTANLQHPHILPLFDSGVARLNRPDECLFYVMPYVEGELLRDRLTREKQLPIADAVRIATEAASALDYAHRHGVIHRDIKPENILLHDGSALVADFGIALAASKAGGARLTETGLSLGTPQYMSPEQATAERELDARSDVYALGATTYEMLTGEPPFTGVTTQAIIAKLMTETPRPPSVLRKAVPEHLEAAVLTALEKLPADRFDSAAAFAEALRNPVYAARTTISGRARRGAERSSAPTRTLATALAVAVALAVWGWLRSTPSQPFRRFPLALPSDQQFDVKEVRTLALLPDGNGLIYSGGGVGGSSQLLLRRWDQLAATAIPGTEGAMSPMVSPDGRRVAFFGPQGEIHTRPLLVATLDGSGQVSVLADSLFCWPLGTWSADGFIYANTFRGGLFRISATGGVPEPLTVLDSARAEWAHYAPDVLPGDAAVVFTIGRESARGQGNEIAVLDLASRRHRVVMPGLAARYSTTGHLIVGLETGAVVAVPFDPDDLEVTGPPIPLFDGLTPANPWDGLNLAVAPSGVLVYWHGQLGAAPRQPVWVDRSGRVVEVDPAWVANRFGHPSLAPDGRKVAIVLAQTEGGSTASDVWIKQLDRGPFTPLTHSSMPLSEFAQLPAWAPDGRSLAFSFSSVGRRDSIDRVPLQRLLSAPADGSRPPAPMASITANARIQSHWSRDGRWLVLGDGDIRAIRPGVDTAPMSVIASPAFDERTPSLSPDGRWLVYASDESGRNEVYVRPFPDATSARWQISAGGGAEPLWSHRGGEIFYRSDSGEMMSVPVRTTPAFSAGAARALFPAAAFFADPGYRGYDVTPDDQRFLMLRLVKRTDPSDENVLVVIENWPALLHRKNPQ